MRDGALLSAAVLWLTFGPAVAQSLYTPTPYRFYVGGGFSWTHSTGYDPTHVINAEFYSPAGKAFGGYQIADWARVEVAYHYLGRGPLGPLQPSPGDLTAHALAGSLLLVSPPLANWLVATPFPVRLLGRLGLAYKDVQQDSLAGQMREGYLAFVVGASLEFDITERIFARLEYEFISTAVGGPPQPVPAFNSMFTATFGGTNNVVNAMHTPLSASVGVRF